MPDLPPRNDMVPRSSSARHMVPAIGVTVNGLVLAGSALLPWAGVTAEVSMFRATLRHSVRGVDDAAGWFVMGAGIIAMLLGVLGLTRNRLYAGFAILPAAIAAFALALFLSNPGELLDRFNFGIAGLIDVYPTVHYGWFAGLIASVVMAGLATIAFVRPR